MTFRTGLRLSALGCIALFVASIYSHWQAGLLASVVFGATLVIVKMFAGIGADRLNAQDKLRARAELHLEPGETLQAVFSAVSGPGPYLAAIISIGASAVALVGRPVVASLMLTLLGWSVTRWTVAATDRAILLLGSSPTRGGITVTRLPRDTRIGPVSGWWAMIWLNGEWMFVHKKFHREVELADNATYSWGSGPVRPSP